METLQPERKSSKIQRLDKLRKPNNPIIPIVNWQNRFARFFPTSYNPVPSPLLFQNQEHYTTIMWLSRDSYCMILHW